MSALTHEGFYREHHSWLIGWVRGRLGQCSDGAADFAQETFLRILQAGSQPPELKRPRPYLATIARGLLVDHFRRQDLERAWFAELVSLPEAVQPSLEERAVLLETLCEIDRLLDGLGPRIRQAFLLSQLEGWTYAEIAQELGMSVSGVKKYMQKAVLQCLRCL